MITSVKQAIINKLLELYPGYTIYDEDVPQKFKTPSFLIIVIEQDYEKRIANKYRSLLSFDVAYFSDKGSTEVKEDCLNKQIKLFRAFDLIGGYRILNKQARITDNVLHFTFNVSYSEMEEQKETLVQTISANIERKVE